MSSLRRQAEHLVTAGTDVMFLMDVRLQPTAEKLIMEARDKAVESVKLRWAEEKWARHEAGSGSGDQSTEGSGDQSPRQNKSSSEASN